MIYYVAHPLGQGTVREYNSARALRWLRWLLTEHPAYAFSMPWYPYTLVMTEVEGRDRGLRDDIRTVGSVDGIVLVGGVLSPGMSQELETAVMLGKKVISYLHLGAEPPGKVEV